MVGVIGRISPTKAGYAAWTTALSGLLLNPYVLLIVRANNHETAKQENSTQREPMWERGVLRMQNSQASAQSRRLQRRRNPQFTFFPRAFTSVVMAL